MQGDHIWIEPVSKREFDVAIGARVVSAEGRKIQVNISNFYFHNLWQDRFNLSLSMIQFYQAYCLDRDANEKRPGASSDNNFRFKKINKNL